MKARLLKKIRFRFDWYFKSNGDPVLIDHVDHSNTVINVEYAIGYASCQDQDHLLRTLGSLSIDEYIRRILMQRLLLPFGIAYGPNVFYRRTRKWWCKKNNKRRVPELIKTS